jgi:hypothetical protein
MAPDCMPLSTALVLVGPPIVPAAQVRQPPSHLCIGSFGRSADGHLCGFQDSAPLNLSSVTIKDEMACPRTAPMSVPVSKALIWVGDISLNASAVTAEPVGQRPLRRILRRILHAELTLPL